MKTKLLIVLMAAALMLTISGTTEAVTLKAGPFLWKAFNWEVGTGYSVKDGVDPQKKFFFRDASTSYATQERGILTYDADNPQHGLFTDLNIFTPVGAMNGEDSWGLVEVRQLESGHVVSWPEPKTPLSGEGGIGPTTPSDVYWNVGDGGEYLRGMFWGVEDQVVEVVSDIDVRIWSDGMKFNILEETTGTWDPLDSANPAPGSALRSAQDTFDTWNDGGGDLWAEGEGTYFRFSGFTGGGIADGDSEIFLDITGGKYFDPPTKYFEKFWNHLYPATLDPALGFGGFDLDPEWSHIKQTWNIGDPVGWGNGWTGSEDTAKGIYTVIPEPVTMLGVFLGVSSLTGYLRKRRMA